MPGARTIVFVTGFELENEWVGICHAVMSRIAPGCRIVDLPHFIEPLSVEAGARLLSDSPGYLPADAVVLAVVGPNARTAQIAGCLPVEEVGPAPEPSSLARLEPREPQFEPGEGPLRGDRLQPLREHPARRALARSGPRAAGKAPECAVEGLVGWAKRGGARPPRTSCRARTA